MSNEPPLAPPTTERRAPYWITLARSVLALVLGLALLLQPDKARPMFLNFMGLFWLTAGIMSLRWSVNGERARRLSVVIGIVSIVSGLLIFWPFSVDSIRGRSADRAAIGRHYGAHRPGSCF